MSQPNPRDVAAEIIDLIFHQPHIDADSPLEEIHLLESVADILEEKFEEIERDYKDEESREVRTLRKEILDLENALSSAEGQVYDLEADIREANRQVAFLEAQIGAESL